MLEQRDNYLRNAELSEEEGYSQIDGILGNAPPKPSVREALRRGQEESARKAETERQLETARQRETARETPPGEGR